MHVTSTQVNTYGQDPTRLFHMDATRGGLPVDVLHTFVDGVARMRVKVLSLVPMVDARGADFTRAETVTLFNDLTVFAPSALLGADVSWETLDTQHVRGSFTNRGVTVSAVLVFDGEHDLVDFVSEDRARTSADGSHQISQSWSTPVGAYRELAGRRVATHGEGRWHAPEPEGEFAYIELRLDHIDDDPDGDRARGASPDRTGRSWTRGWSVRRRGRAPWPWTADAS